MDLEIRVIVFGLKKFVLKNTAANVIQDADISHFVGVKLWRRPLLETELLNMPNRNLNGAEKKFKNHKI